MMATEQEILDQLAHNQFVSSFNTFNQRIQNDQLMCRIYDEYSDPENKNHNCLGCNFDDLTDQATKFLLICAETNNYFSLEQAYSIYVQLLNGIWERMSDVFEIISLQRDYISRHFEPFIRMRRWANFFKHPKAFAWLVHHPVFTIEGSEHSKIYQNDSAYLKIDDEFVKNYYASEKAKGLTQQFDGFEDKVLVILPDLTLVTPAICDCLERFVSIVIDNPIYKEILDQRSTLIDYYLDQEDVE